MKETELETLERIAMRKAANSFPEEKVVFTCHFWKVLWLIKEVRRLREISERTEKELREEQEKRMAIRDFLLANDPVKQLQFHDAKTLKILTRHGLNLEFGWAGEYLVDELCKALKTARRFVKTITREKRHVDEDFNHGL